jgi:iron-sulfur cluster assembly accessory protein
MNRRFAIITTILRPSHTRHLTSILRNVTTTPTTSSTEAHSIGLTERAAAQIRLLRQREQQPLLKLRVAVDGGGCSGFQYAFTLADAVAPGDTVVAAHDAELLVDAFSLPLLRGAVVDYERELVRSAFKVTHNPNATSSCGCGSSFVAKDDAVAQL